MKIGLIGLGKMGSIIAQRLIDGGHEVVGYDTSNHAVERACQLGIKKAMTLEDVARECRIIWLMVPAGEAVDAIISTLFNFLQQGDIVVDGGNSYYRDSMRRAKVLEARQTFFLDCGTSGGLQAQEYGFSLTVGGDQTAFTKLTQIFDALSAPNGFSYVGPSGAGHYVKMVHNGIEYGLLQAYAEGFQLLKEGAFQGLDLQEIARVWNNGAIVRSWILALMEDILARDQDLSQVGGKVGESGTVRWMVADAQAHKIALEVINAALQVRLQSQQSGCNYASKLVAQTRHLFGGHEVEKQ